MGQSMNALTTLSNTGIRTLSTFASQGRKLSTVKDTDKEAIQQFDKLSRAVTSPNVIAAVEKFEEELPERFKTTGDVKHYFGKDLYVRELFIESNTVATGRVHKYDHVCIMLSGRVTMWTPTTGLKEFTGPCVMEIKHGMKRAGYCHERSHWVTAHGVPGCNGEPEKLFDELTTATYAEYLRYVGNNNVIEYAEVLERSGYDETAVQLEMKSGGAILELPAGYEHIYVSNSLIHGDGIFSKITIKCGEIIAPGRIGRNRTIAGRYTNHSVNFNSELIAKDGNVYLVAKHDIMPSEEITINYTQALELRRLNV